MRGGCKHPRREHDVAFRGETPNAKRDARRERKFGRQNKLVSQFVQHFDVLVVAVDCRHPLKILCRNRGLDA